MINGIQIGQCTLQNDYAVFRLYAHLETFASAVSEDLGFHLGGDPAIGYGTFCFRDALVVPRHFQGVINALDPFDRLGYPLGLSLCFCAIRCAIERDYTVGGYHTDVGFLETVILHQLGFHFGGDGSIANRRTYAVTVRLRRGYIIVIGYSRANTQTKNQANGNQRTG